MLSKKIKKDDIEKFLIENPDFFVQKSSILNKLEFPLMEGKKVKNVVSLPIFFSIFLHLHPVCVSIPVSIRFIFHFELKLLKYFVI